MIIKTMQYKTQTKVITSNDGHELDCYITSVDSDEPKDSIVIIQEIFGITDHIKSVCQRYADEGFLVIAPALYDRFEKNITLNYTQFDEGKALRAKLDTNHAILDIDAAINQASGKVSVVGFCYGGMLSHVSAARLTMDCAVSYYGGFIAEDHLHDIPKCPIMYHFGRLDHAIPMDSVELISETFSDAIIHIYDEAGHGFNCEMRADYHEPSSDLAFERSLRFIQENT